MQRQLHVENAGEAGAAGHKAKPLSLGDADGVHQLSSVSPPVDFADRVEAGLQWLEGLRHRPAAALVAVACLALGSVTWWFLLPTESTAVEDQIGFAEATAGLSPSAGLTGRSNTASDLGSPGRNNQPDPGATRTPLAPTTLAEPAQEIARIVVHVVGAVRRPGLVHLDASARVADAVEAAGGFAAEANSELLNLASPLQDGTQILVPTIGDEITSPLIRPAQQSVPIGSGSHGGAGSLSEAAPQVNINTGTSQELMSLPGVGPSIAGAIIAWREENGPFLSVDDLEFVPGIGPAKLEAVRDQVVI